jgi:hypothetical protein
MFIKSAVSILFTLGSLFGYIRITDPTKLEVPQKIETSVQTGKTLKEILPLVSESDIEAWRKVAWCETHGNWQMHGSIYSGGLGIRNDVWLAYGGGEYAPHAGLANMHQQIIVAKRINHSGYVPDQNGCEGSW